MSQAYLADELGISTQQIQKFEKGTCRVSSSRLFDLVRTLGVPVSYFFDAMDSRVKEKSPSLLAAERTRKATMESSADARRETLVLVRAYYGIPERRMRIVFTNLVRAIAGLADPKLVGKALTPKKRGAALKK